MELKAIANAAINPFKLLVLFVIGLCLLFADRLSQHTNGMYGDGTGNASIVGVLVASLLTIIIGVMLFAQFSAQSDVAMEAVNDTAAQDAYENVKTSGWGAMNLVSMYPWVLGAVTILGVVMLLAGGGRN
ncbi:MAG: hypothetical protein ACC612_11410 [Methanomethylovorans sp.]|uniref:hypothetical protein n=1 Tax=Methanomethylovorans sp. TaxID=2758717 RepID=UPI0035314B75